MGDNTRVDLGLRVGMLRGHPRMARGFGAPRGRRVVHRDSNPRMAHGFGAPRGRRVGKAVEWPSNTTKVIRLALGGQPQMEETQLSDQVNLL